MTITRAPGNPGRSKYVEFNGVVHVVATAADRSLDLKGQTARALATIDALLAEAGSATSRLLTATVYITDMARKDDMQEAWMEWVDPEARPMRACVDMANVSSPTIAVGSSLRIAGASYRPRCRTR